MGSSLVVRTLANECITVPSDGRSGGLALLWREGTDVRFKSFSNSHIDVNIHDGSIPTLWRATRFYGQPDAAKRYISWELMEVLKVQSSLPLIVFGDFNKISHSDKQLGGPKRDARQMKDFRECLSQCGLFDLGFVGQRYTWCNGRAGERQTKLRLDRVVASESWIDNFLEASVHHAMWTREAGCRGVIEEAWDPLSTTRFTIIDHLKSCQEHLREWNWRVFGNRSRALWLKWGNQNTKFFHATASQRRRKNKNRREGIESIILEYFTKIFNLCAISKRVSQEINKELVVEFKAEEAPSPDVGADVVNYVLEALNFGMLPYTLNETFICLILKVASPQKITEFKLIGLCNVVYKIISKEVIDESQSAFMPGRSIIDNVQKREGKEALVAVKLDMSKVYDQVEWPYLEAIMRKIGFHEKWIALMMMCISTPKGKIVPSRGLRRAPIVSHLLFADDSIIFCRAPIVECERVLKKIIKEKTSLYFSKTTSMEVQDQVKQRLGAEIVRIHEKYLGLPPLIKDQMGRRIAWWKGKLLSNASREILIKAVTQATPTYTMSDLNSMMGNFWWGQKGRDRRLAWAEGGMGFRDLKAFNLALLVKQGWRIMEQPNSLVHRVYKAKYFEKESFLNAYVERDIIKKGSWWCIGNGQKVHIWNDRWIPRPNSSKVVRPQRAQYKEVMVSDLIDIDRESWDAAKEGTSKVCAEKNIWAVIWKLRLPNKLKVFRWRACHDTLPTSKNLTRRKVLLGLCIVGLCYGSRHLGRKHSKIAEKPAWPVKYDAIDGRLVEAPDFG
ncbi:hypothetical protein ACB092_05G056600 [Castanea dentata]